jgi:hypothetical protein
MSFLLLLLAMLFVLPSASAQLSSATLGGGAMTPAFCSTCATTQTFDVEASFLTSAFVPVFSSMGGATPITYTYSLALGPWHLKYYSTTVTPNTPYVVPTAVGNSQACTSACTAPEGTQTPAIYLNPGMNILTVKCSTYTYIFRVYRLSDDATLSNLVCDTAALTPNWDPYWAIPWQTTSYTGFVTTVTSSMATLTCTPTRSQATPVPRYGWIRHQSTSVPGDPLKTVATNTPFTWPLVPGRNLFQIFVTAEYTPSVAYYNVLVHRPSDDSTLSLLTANSVSLVPVFNRLVLWYTGTVAAAVNTSFFTPGFSCTCCQASNTCTLDDLEHRGRCVLSVSC